MENKNVGAYRLAYEKANNKKLVITFDETGQFFYVEGLPYRMSNMNAMTQNLNDRIERSGKLPLS